MTEILQSPAEDSSTMNSNYDEDDEETRDFYIYILSREHPTVLTPVPNPYKRSDRIKEANAELQSGSPTLSSRPGTRIRFNDTPTMHEYVKQEDVLCVLTEDFSPHKTNSPSINHSSTNSLTNEQPVIKTRQMNGWSNEPDVENEDINNRVINKENTSEEVDFITKKLTKRNIDNSINKNNALNNENKVPVVSSTVESKIDNEITFHPDAFVRLEEIDISSTVESSPDTKTVKYHEEHDLKTLSLRQNTKTNKTKNVNNENNADGLNDSNRPKPNTKDNTEEIRSTHSAINKKMESSSLEEDMVRENYLTLDTVQKNSVINNAEDKLNYRPSSTERIRNYNKQANATMPIENKERTSTSDKQEKVKTDMTKSNPRINTGIKKSVNKSKTIIGKQDTTTELTNKTAKPQALKLNKSEVSKVQASKSNDLENKNSARIKSTRHSSIEIKEDNESSQATGMNNGAATPSSDETHGTNLNDNLETNNHLLLSPEEVKSTLEEIKERNRSKLVVLVPPFEQYKSYMNDNYSDSDDNESIDLEEYFRKEDPTDDLTYLPDFELESDNELDNLCKENSSFRDLVNLYPEDMRRNKLGSKMNTSLKKKARDNNTSSKDVTRSLEDDELRRHRYKMMDNIKSSEQYSRLAQDSGDSSTKCKQKCSQRPSTAPGGRKFCDCKWPRVKLPEYNGLRSEYGLSAEQLSERKRQRQEIARRTKERRQRKVDEEERRKMENEKMFHEWLLKKRQQAKEQWLRNQRLRALRYSRQCITPNQPKAKLNQNKSNTPLAIRKKLHPGRNCFSLDEIISDVTEHDENKTYKIYLGLSIE